MASSNDAQRLEAGLQDQLASMSLGSAEPTGVSVATGSIAGSVSAYDPYGKSTSVPLMVSSDESPTRATAAAAGAEPTPGRIVLRLEDDDDEEEEEADGDDDDVDEEEGEAMPPTSAGGSRGVDYEYEDGEQEYHENDEFDAAPTPMRNVKAMAEEDGTTASTTYTLDELPDYGLRGHELHIKHELCDAIIQARGKTLHCHRFVLASSSQFFYKWFMQMEANNDHSFTQPKELSDVDGDALETIIKALYTREVEVTTATVEPLLATADRVDIGPVWDACIDFLIRHLNPGNCLRGAELADRYSSEDLQVEAHAYLCQHFEDVAAHISWALLSKAQVMSILSSDELSVRSELEVFNAVMNWVQHKEERDAHLAELLALVRLPWMTAEEMRIVTEEDLIRMDVEAMNVLTEGILDKVFEGRQVPPYPQWLRPRKPLYVQESPARLHTIGLQKVLVHDWSRGVPQWVETAGPVITGPLGTIEGAIWTGWTTMNGTLFMARHMRDHTQLLAYSPHLRVTKQIASPCHPRRLAAMAALDGRVYIMGGRTDGSGSVAVSTVDCYDTKTGQWVSVPPMQVARHSLGAAALDGQLYAVGGDRHERSAKHSRRVEIYDPYTGKWVAGPKLTVPRSGVSVCALDGSLYAVGGHAGGHALAVVERYVPARGRWQVVASMNTPRAYSSVCAFDGCLYVGDSWGPGINYKPSDTMECYDPATNKWTPVDCTDARPPGACGALVVM